MTKHKRNPTYIVTNRTVTRMRRIVTGLVLGGSLVVASAIVLSVPETPVAEAIPAEAEPAPEARPAWAQSFDAPAADTIEIDAPVVDAPAIELREPTIEAEVGLQAVGAADETKRGISIAHEDTETDFAAAAEKHIDEGDLEAALLAMRKHVHGAEATQDELFLIGTLARQVQDSELAESALLEAASLKPERSTIKTELARLYLEMDEYAAARTAARDAIAIEREDPAAWNALGRIAMAESQWEQAQMAYSHALELDPTNPMYHNNAGLLYIYMKRGLDAVDALETAVELFEDDAPHFVFNNLGLAHELSGQHEEAREAYEEALLLNPFYSRAKVNLQRVEKAIAKAEADSAFQTAQGTTAAVSDGT